jgi:ribonuclease P protein component
MQHLRSRAQFQAVLAGQTAARTAHFAVHQLALPLGVTPPLPATEACFGAMAPKRWAKRAVTRNAIKRQIFAVADQFAPAMQNFAPTAYVVRLKAAFDRKQFVSASSDALKAAVRAELTTLFTQLCKRQTPSTVVPP